MKLRESVREVQLLENKAAQKAGLRFLLLEEDKLFGKGGKDYAVKYVAQLIDDLSPEILQAPRIGLELAADVMGKK
jgi:hypothetical protein